MVPKWSPKRLQMALLGDLPNTSWICYLLHLGHMGLPRDAPKCDPKSKQDSEALPEPIFVNFKRIWGSIWEPIWHHFGSFLGVRFWSRFLDGFWGADVARRCPAGGQAGWGPFPWGGYCSEDTSHACGQSTDWHGGLNSLQHGPSAWDV